MQRLPVDSSDIISIGYDPKIFVLEIEFKEGRVYQYAEVEAGVYDRFIHADSYGEFFYSFINKRYRYKRVAGESRHGKVEKLAFVSGNARKMRDLQAACDQFGIEIEQLDLPVAEVQSHDASEVAIAKAKDAYRLAQRPVVVNDTFWNIIALRGFPGGFARYIDDWFKPDDFLCLMDGKTDRTIICTDTLVYYDGKRHKLFSDDVRGTIATEAHGNGKSLEQLTVISGEQGTIAEVQEKEGRSCLDPDNNIWHNFAKWYNLQLRLKKV